jgi:predicted transcriptional regulator
VNVADIMTEQVVTVDQSQSLYDALQVMFNLGCHHLSLMSKQGHLVGILSDHDYRRALNWPHLR